MTRSLAFAILFSVIQFTATAEASSCRALDGDTFICRGERIRLENADAPELHARCDAELEAARAARAFAQAALDGAREIKIEIGRRARDRHGRTLAHVLVDGKDLGELLVGVGLARPYHGERRRGWCE